MVLPIHKRVASYNNILYSVFILNNKLRIAHREESSLFVQQQFCHFDSTQTRVNRTLVRLKTAE
jgi:hypothetical protein